MALAAAAAAGVDGMVASSITRANKSDSIANRDVIIIASPLVSLAINDVAPPICITTKHSISYDDTGV